MTRERLPAHDSVAERSLLGSVLLDNSILDIAGQLDSDEFYSPAHVRIWRAMLALARRQQPVDTVTLRTQLASTAELEAVGGDAYLLGLTNTIPDAENAEAHAKIIADAARIRQLVRVCTEIASSGYDPQVADDYLERAQNKLGKVLEGRHDNRNVRNVAAILDGLHRQIIDGGAVTPLRVSPTGIAALDHALTPGGIASGELAILAARPAMGKTALAMQIAEHCATVQHVLVASYEMSDSSLVMRSVAGRAGVPMKRLIRPDSGLTRAEYEQVIQASARMAPLNLWVRDCASDGATLEDVVDMARARHRRGELDLLVVDYVQLMRTRARHDSREQEVGAISRGLKLLARQLQIPVLALAQLNREVEKRQDKRPNLGDLRESGAIEQDADIILFLYRESVYDRSADPRACEYILAKQRNGETGIIRGRFIAEQTHFAEIMEPAL